MLFDQFHKMLTIPRKLALQTRHGTDIPNEQSGNPDRKVKEVFDALTAKHRHWRIRKEPTGIYNCAGHALANRRTAIYNDIAWRDILKDDGYSQIDSADDLQLGDLVMYVDGQASDVIFHIAVVAEIEQAQGLPIKKVWLLSKLDGSSGEVFHDLHDYQLPTSDWRIEFWTDRITR